MATASGVVVRTQRWPASYEPFFRFVFRFTASSMKSPALSVGVLCDVHGVTRVRGCGPSSGGTVASPDASPRAGHCRESTGESLTPSSNFPLGQDARTRKDTLKKGDVARSVVWSPRERRKEGPRAHASAHSLRFPRRPGCRPATGLFPRRDPWRRRSPFLPVHRCSGLRVSDPGQRAVGRGRGSGPLSSGFSGEEG